MTLDYWSVCNEYHEGKVVKEKYATQLTIPLKESASLLRNFLLWPFAALTLLSINVLNQKSQDCKMSSNNDVINVLNILAGKESW